MPRPIDIDDIHELVDFQQALHMIASNKVNSDYWHKKYLDERSEKRLYLILVIVLCVAGILFGS